MTTDKQEEAKKRTDYKAMKTAELIIVAILGIICFGAVYIAHRQYHEIENLNSVIKEKDSKITYWQNKKGQTISEKPAAQVSTKDFKNDYPELLKTVKDMNIKLRSLQAVISARFNAVDSGTARIDTVYRIDSIGRNEAENNIRIDDGYLKEGIKWTNPNQVHWNYIYSDSITFAFDLKKKWFLGKQNLYGTGMLSNPNARITNQTAVQIKNYKDKRFIIGAGVSYDPLSGQVHPTAGLYYALFKF